MVTVDEKGRIVLPQAIRERLGIIPGAELDVHEEDGRAIIELEDDPESIIDDLETMIGDAASRRSRTPNDELAGEAKRHVDTIRRQASDTGHESGDR